LKILDIILDLDPSGGGPQHTVRAMSRVWRSLGHQADILTLDAADAPYLEPDLPVFALGRQGARRGRSHPFARYGYSRGAAAKAARIVRDYDVVLVHGLWNYSTLLARRVLIGAGVPYFVFVHGMLDPWHQDAYPLKDRIKQLLWPLNEGALLQHARAAFFTTQVERDLAQGRYRPWHVNPVVVSYGCEGPEGDPADTIAAFHDAFPRLRGRKYLLFLSRIHQKKGCDTLLRAFARAQADLGDIDLVMAGPDQTGWRAELQALAGELGLAERLHWTGPITGAVKWGAYRAAEAFVLPSHGENFGIVVAEALACGTPVLISDRVNLYHAVLDHQAGLVGAHDLDGTVALLRQFAAMPPAERTAMAHAAQACFHAHFELNAAAHNVLDTMRTLAGLAPAPQVLPA
jgi:glycosyltransferase involved in cell wall biosynthesis